MLPSRIVFDPGGSRRAGHDAGEDRQPGRIAQLERHDDEAGDAPALVGAEDQAATAMLERKMSTRTIIDELGIRYQRFNRGLAGCSAAITFDAATAIDGAQHEMAERQAVQQQPHRQQRRRQQRIGQQAAHRPSPLRRRDAAAPTGHARCSDDGACRARAVVVHVAHHGPALDRKAERQQQQDDDGDELDHAGRGERSLDRRPEGTDADARQGDQGGQAGQEEQGCEDPVGERECRL